MFKDTFQFRPLSSDEVAAEAVLFGLQLMGLQPATIDI